MALESSNGLGTLSSYGTRATEGKYGAQIPEKAVKHVMYELDSADLQSLTPGVYSGLDFVFPIGTNFLDCRIVVEQAVTSGGLMTVDVGTYTFNTTTKAVTAHDLDGLVAGAAVATLDAVGDVVKGAGALLATGTGAAFAVTAPVILRIQPNVAVATAGKFRVYVTYLAPSY